MESESYNVDHYNIARKLLYDTSLIGRNAFRRKCSKGALRQLCEDLGLSVSNTAVRLGSGPLFQDYSAALFEKVRSQKAHFSTLLDKTCRERSCTTVKWSIVYLCKSCRDSSALGITDGILTQPLKSKAKRML